jgi:prepilin-type N-terminal cleavage/methylation domain-containing protein
MMMTSNFRRHAAKGFTLIELLIVVIIIAILAAIAIPQFSNTAGDAQESALDANLNTVRSAIELYRIQHNNVYPGVNVSTGGAAACGAAGGALGTGAVANDPAAFRDQLIGFSNAQGQTCTVTAAGFIFGPYIREIPTEPVNNNRAVNMDVVANAPAPAAGGAGWRFNTITGRFIINNSAMDRRNVPLSNH